MTAHKTLFEAMLAVKAAAPALKKDATNPHFKSRYVTLDAIDDVIGPLLVEHGLVWATMPTATDSGAPALHYALTHVASGEKAVDTMPLLLDKPTMQGLGSAITYARRYALECVLNLVADEDDDGHSASSSPPPAAAASNGAASVKQQRLIKAKAAEARIPGDVLANILLASAGKEVRSWASTGHAQKWVEDALHQFPASRVDVALKNIAAEATP